MTAKVAQRRPKCSARAAQAFPLALWFVAMLCPCGCKETLQMSLLHDANPQWKIIEHGDGTITLQPSVWRKVGCRSHFFLRRGLIQWCPDESRCDRY
jgi:hypothetical protein